MSGIDSTLTWHREYRPGPRKRLVTSVKAWASELDPDATLPPYYRITVVAKNMPVRVVYLINCKVCGGDKIEVCVEDSLATAKAAALFDYRRRLTEQRLARR